MNQYVIEARAVLPMVAADPSPKLISAPVVSGSLVRGATLTTTTGAYTNSPTGYSYQWQRDGADIFGATSQTYVTTSDDVSHRIRVLVTASNADGSAVGTSASVGLILPQLPTSTQAPVASGTPKRGSTLTATSGTWTENPTSYTYQWQRDKGTGFVNISGATTVSYTLVVSDLTASIRVLVTARNASGPSTSPATSNAVGPVAGAPPVNSGVPQISGTAARGSALVAAAGTWGGAGNSYSFQWQHYANSTWTTIASATLAGYTVPAGDEGFKLRVLVTASNYDGTVTVASDPTDTVVGAPPVLTSVPAPTGTPSRGSALTARQGTWDGVGNTFKYQWQRDLGSGYSNIAGATAISYVLQPADTGASIRVQVTATNVDGTASGLSDAVGPVVSAAPVNSAPPVASGTPARASTLTTTTGTWSGAGNLYSYQWQKDPGTGWVDIAGATKSTYVAQKTDEASELRVKVTATNVDGVVSVTSDPTDTIAAMPPVNTGIPLVTGTLQRTKAVSGSQGTWTGPGNVYTYQWQRDSGSGFADIAGATANLYVLTQADVGAKLRIKVTATNPDAAVSAYSLDTAAVALAAPIQAASPVVTGTARTGLVITTSAGSWMPAGATFAYQWQVDDGNGFQDIAGATSPNYTLTDDEAGLKVRAQVTATNADGSTVTYSNALGPVLASPVNTVAPAVTGTLTDAATFTATPGTWESAGGFSHTYRFQWVRCPQSATSALACNTITGASNSTYTSVTADIGSKLAVRVTATNTLNVNTVVASALTGVIVGRDLTNTILPAIRGTAAVREKLTATAGEWSVPLTRVSYQWRRCTTDGLTCTDIPNATASTYVASVADTGKILVVKVYAASPSWTETAESAPTAEVEPLPIPSTDVAVVINGTPARTQTLRTTMPSWDGYPTTYGYEWQRCDVDGTNCAVIANARGNAYVLTKADEDFTVRVRLTATNTTGTGETLSAPTAVVAAVVPVSVAPPTISGNVVTGQTLSSARGSWTATTDTSYTFAWQRCAADGTSCAPIAGATMTTYKLVADDIGATIRVIATAANPDGVTTATSVQTAKIKAAPPAAYPMPALSGVAQVGKVISATTGTWTGVAANVTTTFWRCTTTCTAIQTGTDRTITLTPADAGYKIRASVTGVGPGGTTTIYATAILGPVKSATVGAIVAAAAPVSIKGSTGTVLAKVAAKTPAAGGTATVTVTPVKKGYRAWACPTADTTCTKPVRLGSRPVKIRVAVDAGEKVSVVVAKK